MITEPLACLRKCRIMVPSIPIRAGPPRANDHSLIFMVGGAKELSSYPTLSLPRGRQTPAHDGVPIPAPGFRYTWVTIVFIAKPPGLLVGHCQSN